MNCMHHPSEPAVTSCVKCNVGMCRDCVQNSITVDHKSLCRSCAPGELRQSIAYFKKVRSRSRMKLTFTAIVMGLGVLVALLCLLQKDLGGAVQTIFMSFGMAGVLSVMAGMWKNGISDAVWVQSVVGKGDQALMTGCFMIIIAIPLGVIVAPYNLYRFYRDARNADQEVTEQEGFLKMFA